MKAARRLGFVIGTAALALAVTPALAQDSPPPPPADAPVTNAIGPRELQNFSIDGTVTRRADPAPAQRSATPPPAPRATARPAVPAAAGPGALDQPAPAPSVTRSAEPRVPAPSAAAEPSRAPPRISADPTSPPGSSVTVPLPPLDARVSGSEFAPAAAGENLSPGRGFGAWPWLLAAIALVLGGLFLWRSRTRHAYAGYAEQPHADAFAAPEPARAPAPTPTPRPRLAPALPTPAALGIVSTRLRPRLEIGFKPLRCMVDEQQVTVDFEIELTNSGSAPARAVLIEASMFNAGPTQDQAIGAFFDNPVGQGERIPTIAPLRRMAVRSQVAVPRANVQLFKVEGREMLVPLIAFNALYGWSGGEAQTSSAYLVGRDTHQEKLAPLRADLGARQFVDLGARPLPNGVRS